MSFQPIKIVPADPSIKVVVHFHAAVPHHAQGVSLLEMERTLRKMTGLDIRVLKDLMQDDSKLRVMMSDTERSQL